MELLQDAVVVLLNVTLFGMGFMFLYRVWREIIALGNLQESLSNIIFVVITIELYRLLVHYLRYHKVDLNIPRRGGRVGDNPKGSSGRGGGVHHATTGGDLPDTRVPFGAILWVDMHGARLIVVWGSSSARRQPRFGTLPGRE